MTALADLISHAKPPVVAVRAIVANKPVNMEDDLFVTVLAYDGSRQKWGPCQWVPSNVMPDKGDECLLILTEDDGTPWVLTTSARSISYPSIWVYDTTDAQASGDAHFDGGSWATVAHVLVNRLNKSGTDVSHLLDSISRDDNLVVQRQDDASQYGHYNVTGAATRVGDVYSIPVTPYEQAGSIPANNGGVVVSLITPRDVGVVVS